MAVKIICDSAADITSAFAKENDIKIIPLKTIIDGREYLDGVELSPEEFYKLQKETKDFPTTSQISPAEFADAYMEVTEGGDEAVVITISSGLSGTYQSATIAADEYEGKVFVVDSLNVAIGEQLLVHLALRLKDEGLSAAEIKNKLNSVHEKMHLLASFDTLEYLFRGGRLSRTSAVAGAMLNIKPIFTIENGKLEIVAKARGNKGRNSAMNDIVRVCGEIDFSHPVLAAYTGDNKEPLDEYLESGADIWADAKEIPTCLVGSTVGAHAGPGAVAIAFFVK